MEREQMMTEDEARREGEAVRFLANDLAAQDHLQKPEASHYQEADATLNTRRGANPEAAERFIDQVAEQKSYDKDLENSVN